MLNKLRQFIVKTFRTFWGTCPECGGELYEYDIKHWWCERCQKLV